MPVRKLRPSKGINRRCIVNTTMSNNGVFSESLLERDFVRLIKFERKFNKIEYQPLKIEYVSLGKNRGYTPDFRLDSEYGTCIVEVKRECEVAKEENQYKFTAAQKLCDSKGWQFKVYTELDIRPGYFQKNLMKLFRVQDLDLPQTETRIILERLKAIGPCSIQALKLECSSIANSIFKACLYKLILQHEISVDLINQKLSLNSIICSADKYFQ
ncbi:TnsA endonuclease N-terminal domain-containing protein [Paenibacillus frigoriresistens]|uniref:TnsA endonuclease N-terminal domain-containing protein n=1 Tax=Paenibacillus alginolyticus TaxID=59839 RepID=UPI001565E5C3|nr:TnsA endonuclease N-terminal domain-containing protein [Paenibacillus frigoriresistens]NRF95290.1 TnsA endonuclease N-terminal domain-containing protein [Paenibacillus frigoriresistens]